MEYPIRLGQVGASVKLTYEQVTEIIDDLMNTNLSLRKIAITHGCEYKDVLGIKNGTTKLYRRRGLTYPLRPNN